MSTSNEKMDNGPCCICGKEDETVRNIAFLSKKAPVPGTGWGCVQCDLPPDGAVAIVCDECNDGTHTADEIKHAVDGFLTEKKRIPVIDLEGSHEHDVRKHPELHINN